MLIRHGFLVVSQHLLKDQWIVTLNHYEGAQRNYAGEVFVDLLDTDNMRLHILATPMTIYY